MCLPGTSIETAREIMETTEVEDLLASPPEIPM